MNRALLTGMGHSKAEREGPDSIEQASMVKSPPNDLDKPADLSLRNGQRNEPKIPNQRSSDHESTKSSRWDQGTGFQAERGLEMSTRVHEQSLLPNWATSQSTRDEDAESVQSGRSGASSIASVADSIFSFISGSSMSSVAAPQSAVDILVALILSDRVVKSLCTEGLGVFERVRFGRNLRRLLKEFAIALRKEAETQDERHAANFVRVRARNSTYVICSSLGSKKKFKEVFDIDFENVSEESDGFASDEEVEDLQHVEAFIRGSFAFSSLRDNLKAFIQSHGTSKANAPQPHSFARHDVREMQSSKSLLSAPDVSDKQLSQVGSANELEPPKENVSSRLMQEPDFKPLFVSYVDSLYDGYGYTTPSDSARHDSDEDATKKLAKRHSIDFQMIVGHGNKEKMAEDDFNVRYQYSDKVQAVGSRSDAVSHAVPNVSTEDIGISESPALKTRRFAEASEILRALNIVQRICSVFETKQPKMTRGWPVQYKCV